ncbi:MAG: hypothetical protein ACE5KJ_08655, partial [Candidatus Zixiibacteriota bacterium]
LGEPHSASWFGIWNSRLYVGIGVAPLSLAFYGREFNSRPIRNLTALRRIVLTDPSDYHPSCVPLDDGDPQTGASARLG